MTNYACGRNCMHGNAVSTVMGLTALLMIFLYYIAQFIDEGKY